MRKYISSLKHKPEPVRKQILMISMVVSMTIVGSVWIYSFGGRFNESTVAKAKDDIKPFTLFGASVVNTYKDTVASVNNSSDDSAILKNDHKLDNVVPVDPISEQ